ncbi:MAG: enoyl-CoA hydratase/isomerase family protein [Acidobacteriota bacterium]
MSFEHLSLATPAGNVLQVYLNRPRQMNSLNHQTIRELTHAIQQFENSEEEFLILSGSGRAFCFGADFHEFENREALPDLLSLFQELILKIYHCSKITIAALNGFATGAGLDLALACDFRIAAEKVKLGEAYINMGLVPDGGGTFFVPHFIGTGRAMEMLIRGEAIAAEDALQIGLVHRVCPPGELQQFALKFALDLSSKPKKARQLIKALVKNPSGSLEEALRKERDAQLICFQDSEHQTLAEEFLKKRRKESNAGDSARN